MICHCECKSEQFSPTLIPGCPRFYKDELGKKGWVSAKIEVTRLLNIIVDIKFNIFYKLFYQTKELKFLEIPYYSIDGLLLKFTENSKYINANDSKSILIHFKKFEKTKQIFIKYRFNKIGDFPKKTKFKLCLYNNDYFETIYLSIHEIWSKRKVKSNIRQIIKTNIDNEINIFYKEKERNPNQDEMDNIKKELKRKLSKTLLCKNDEKIKSVNRKRLKSEEIYPKTHKKTKKENMLDIKPYSIELARLCEKLKIPIINTSKKISLKYLLSHLCKETITEDYKPIEDYNDDFLNISFEKLYGELRKSDINSNVSITPLNIHEEEDNELFSISVCRYL